MNPVVFYAFSSLTVVAVIFMIFSTNPVSSAICLVAAFFGLAGLYVGLDAHFVAAIQILVYAGAIMVLFVFVIMLLNLREHELVYDRMTLKKVGVTLTGLTFFGFFAFYFLKIPHVNNDGTPNLFPPVEPEFGVVRSVGKLLFTDYVVPFEIIAILLLIGLVGAVMLGKRE